MLSYSDGLMRCGASLDAEGRRSLLVGLFKVHNSHLEGGDEGDHDKCALGPHLNAEEPNSQQLAHSEVDPNCLFMGLPTNCHLMP